MFKSNLFIIDKTKFFTRYMCSIERQIPKTEDEFRKLQFKSKEQSKNSKFLKVTIVGCPNAGKSTLLNKLINWKVSAVSSKVHTTRENIIGVYVHSNTQIEFVDTPGLVSRQHVIRHHLESSFIKDLKYSVQKAGLIAVLTDVSNKRESVKLNKGIIELLEKNIDKESVLILNKVDKVKEKRKLLELIPNLTCACVGGRPLQIKNSDSDLMKFEIKQGKFDKIFEKTEHYLNYKDKNENTPKTETKIGWPKFDQVFMISALHNDGIEELRNYFLAKAKPESWIYQTKVVTLQNPKKLIIDSIREVCLELFYQEIPYKFTFQIVLWETNEIGDLYIVVDLFCPEKFMALLIGSNGSNISTIVNKSRANISNIFKCDVSLKIAVKKSFKNKVN